MVEYYGIALFALLSRIVSIAVKSYEGSLMQSSIAYLSNSFLRNRESQIIQILCLHLT